MDYVSVEDLQVTHSNLDGQCPSLLVNRIATPHLSAPPFPACFVLAPHLTLFPIL